jgi:hypothetical protein
MAMNYRLLRPLWLIAISAGLLMAAEPAWKSKPPAQWSEADAQQVLESSPWTKEVRAGVTRRLSEDELREGGKMGQPTGLGYDGVDPNRKRVNLPTKPTDLVLPESDEARRLRSAIPGITVRLRWESALPVRLAELKARQIEPPTLEAEGYRIAVYGLPGGYFKGDPKKLGAPLKDQAFIRREGKKDVKPSSVEAFHQADGWVVVYLFPYSAEVSPKDKQIEFGATIGRIVVLQTFDLSEMVFSGKLEL